MINEQLRDIHLIFLNVSYLNTDNKKIDLLFEKAFFSLIAKIDLERVGFLADEDQVVCMT